MTKTPEQWAEEYAEVTNKGVNKFGETIYSAKELGLLQSSKIKIRAFLAGYNKALEVAREVGSEFDAEAALAEMARLPENAQGREIYMARWQHSQDQLVIGALREGIAVQNICLSLIKNSASKVEQGYEIQVDMLRAQISNLQSEIERLRKFEPEAD